MTELGMEHRWRVRFRKGPVLYPETLPDEPPIEVTELSAESREEAEARVLSFRKRNRVGYEHMVIVDSELIL